MSAQDQINYIEMPAADLEATRAFFTAAFDWSFTDYGPDYIAFSQGIDGGFFRVDARMSPRSGSALVVLFSEDLAASQASVEAAGGEIAQPIYDFPGGRRFHFIDPGGNEFAVWGEARD